MSIKAQIITGWQMVNGLNVPEAGQFITDQQVPGQGWTDVSGSAVPVTPNSVVIEAFGLTPATFAAIEADNRFYVLWSEGDGDG